MLLFTKSRFLNSVWLFLQTCASHKRPSPRLFDMHSFASTEKRLSADTRLDASACWWIASAARCVLFLFYLWAHQFIICLAAQGQLLLNSLPNSFLTAVEVSLIIIDQHGFCITAPDQPLSFPRLHQWLTFQPMPLQSYSSSARWDRASCGIFSESLCSLRDTGRCPWVDWFPLLPLLEDVMKLLWICNQVTEHTPGLQIDIL